MSSITSSKFSHDISKNLLELLEENEHVLPNVPSGKVINCHGWKQESALRMLLNQQELNVSSVFGKLPAYEYDDSVNWQLLKNNVKSVLELGNDETLVINPNHENKVIKTNKKSPRIIFVNFENKNFEKFNEESFLAYDKSLLSNWSYIGVQELFPEINKVFKNFSEKNYYGDLEEKIIVTSGLGRLGAAQVLGITMNKGVAIVVEPNRKLAEQMVEDGYCNLLFEDFDTAFDFAKEAKRNGQAKAFALVSNSAEVMQKLVHEGITPNVITDATNANDPLNGYIPTGYSFIDAMRIRKRDPQYYKNLSTHSIMLQVKAMVDLQNRGSNVFEFTNGLREKAFNRGLHSAFSVPSMLPEYFNPVVTDKNKGIFKWVALSGDKEDIFIIDDIILSEFNDNPDLSELIDITHKVITPYGLPSRKCILDFDTAKNLFKVINELVRDKELSAPILLEYSNFSDSMNPKTYISDGNIKYDDFLSKLIKNNNYGSSTVTVNLTGNLNEYYIYSNKTYVIEGNENFNKDIEKFLTQDKKISIPIDIN